MRRNTEFKILLETLDNSRLFSVRHLLSAKRVSDCQGFLKYTEGLIIALFFSLAE